LNRTVQCYSRQEADHLLLNIGTWGGGVVLVRSPVQRNIPGSQQNFTLNTLYPSAGHLPISTSLTSRRLPPPKGRNILRPCPQPSKAYGRRCARRRLQLLPAIQTIRSLCCSTVHCWVYVDGLGYQEVLPRRSWTSNG